MLTRFRRSNNHLVDRVHRNRFPLVSLQKLAEMTSSQNTGKQDVPNVLWVGARDGDAGPIMLAREKPEAFKLKVK